MEYQVKQGQIGKSDFTFYGGARDAVRCKASEVLLHGPAETGKTFSILMKLHLCACKYPGTSIVIMRKTQTSTYPTVVEMFKEKVLGDNSPVEPYGGERPSWFHYPNESRIWVAGLDKASRILSAEHDIIFWNQIEEGELAEWETCTTRTTGRAGHMPYGQTIGDMNPTYPGHWPYHRDSIHMFHSYHNENPILYDQVTGEITLQGKKTMSVLEALTGARRVRLLDGKAVQAEGAILSDYSEAIHRIYRKNMPKCFRHVAGVDWGYSRPGCMGVWGIDGRNGNMYLVAQYYHAHRLDDWWLDRALELHDRFSRMVIYRGGKRREYMIEAWVCDPSQPAYIQKFANAGLNAVPAFNAVRPGLDAVQARLVNAVKGKGDGLYFVRDNLLLKDQELADAHLPTCTEEEIPGYVWASTEKEQPVKKDDHGMDMTRYTVAYVDNLGEAEMQEAGTW